MAVEADADAAALEEIRAAAEAGSPVLDNIRNGTPIEGHIRRPGGA